MLHTTQIRAARALLGWRQEDLAEAANVGLATIQRIEAGKGLVSGNVGTIVRIQKALEAEGIRFLDADSTGGLGVRLNK